MAIAGDVRSLIGTLLRDGVERLYFMGTGGVQLLTLPAIELAQRRSAFPVSAQFPAQVVLDPPAALGRDSLVVLPSLSGTTKESVELLSFLKARGARTLSLTGHADTPLGRDADHTFTNFAEDDTSSESFYLQNLLIVLAPPARRPGRRPHPLPASAARAAARPPTIKDDGYHIFTGAGSVWPQAHYYGMCILEEMQWIRTRPVHAADFFHGTLELVEPGVSVFVLKGEDPYRPLSERVERFAARYTDRVRVLDSADVALPGISPDVRALISPIILATLLERVSAHLEVLRDHPLTTRRYYKRVAY